MAWQAWKGLVGTGTERRCAAGKVGRGEVRHGEAWQEEEGHGTERQMTYEHRKQIEDIIERLRNIQREHYREVRIARRCLSEEEFADCGVIAAAIAALEVV